MMGLARLRRFAAGPRPLVRNCATRSPGQPRGWARPPNGVHPGSPGGEAAAVESAPAQWCGRWSPGPSHARTLTIGGAEVATSPKTVA
jgi:hypothetical protein